MSLRKERNANDINVERQEVIAHWVQIISMAASSYNVGTIWMTQLGYRLWVHIQPEKFAEYHRSWWEGWGGIQPIVFPPGIIATLGSLAQLRWRSPRVPKWLVWLNVLLQIQSWLLTGVFWAPLQARLQQTQRADGTLDRNYQLLMRSHWLRVALFTGCGILQFWMSIMSFLPQD
jgi:hypothetical protein